MSDERPCVHVDAVRRDDDTLTRLTKQVMTGAPAIEAVGVRRRFGGVTALHDVHLAVARGECHAVVGENGAGKSTLMRILSGLLLADEGTVRVDGETATRGHNGTFASVALVHQELDLVPELSIAENICLGAAPTTAGFVRWREQDRIARKALAQIGLEIDVRRSVATLSVAVRQFVEIARALRQSPSVLILDEPSATLTPQETNRLLALLRRLAAESVAVIYISHRLPEIFSLCEKATVLRDGRRVATLRLAESSPAEVGSLMVGRALEQDRRRGTGVRCGGRVVLAAKGVRAKGVRNANLEVRAGEIVGIGGLVGSGRTELLRALVGLEARSSGSVRLATHGGDTREVETYHAAVRRGLAFLPEERRAEGLCLDWTVADNILLAGSRGVSRFGVRSTRQARRLAQAVIERLSIRPTDPGVVANSLSGGNQQKAAFGKWIAVDPLLLVLDEPTRGVDVGAKAELHELVRDLASRGAGVLFVSSDLPELLVLADRIAIMRDGEIAGWIDGEHATEGLVMHYATGSDAHLAVGAERR